MGQRTVGKQRSVLRHAPRHRALAPRREPCPAGSCGSLRPRPGREGSAVARAAAAVVDLSSGFVADVQVAVVGGLAKCLASPRGTAPLWISRRPPVRRDAPVPLAFGDARPFAYVVGHLCHPFDAVAALGLADIDMLGPVGAGVVPLAGGAVLASGQVGLAYLWLSVSFANE